MTTQNLGTALIPNQQTLPVVPGDYTFRHTGSGNFIVLNVVGNQVGPVISNAPGNPGLAKQIAQGYVARLNDGVPPDQVF